MAPPEILHQPMIVAGARAEMAFAREERLKRLRKIRRGPAKYRMADIFKLARQIGRAAAELNYVLTDVDAEYLD